MSHLLAPGERPLRADARRNREKVLAAARAVFSEQGRDAQMDDVARRAGVGVGTVYRHFPTKEALIEALMVSAFETIAAAADAALEVEDPWEAFVGFVRRCAELQAADLALSQVLQDQPALMCGAVAGRQDLTDAAGELVRRAQDAGVLRSDLMVDDIPMVMCGIGSATKKEHRCPDAWRRHLAIVLDGLRAPSASGPLPR